MRSSTVGLRLDLKSRLLTTLSYDIRSQIIGHILGDGWIGKSKTSKYPYFVFTQSLKRFEYVWYVYNNLSCLCQKSLTLSKSIRRGKTYYFIQLHTRSYPCLLNIYNMFYKINNNKIVKVIPNSIIDYLNPIVLAYWAMDDGAFASGGGFYLHTKSFSFLEVYKLAGLLHYKFNIFCTVQNHDNKPVIYIQIKSIELFKNIVSPYYHKSLLYKFSSKKLKTV